MHLLEFPHFWKLHPGFTQLDNILYFTYLLNIKIAKKEEEEKKTIYDGFLYMFMLQELLVLDGFILIDININ